MYIWIAIDVNEQVRELREYAGGYTKTHGLISPTLTLPFHISLKISFQIPDTLHREVVRDIRDFFKSLKPFTIRVKKAEASGTILWLTMQDTAELTYIHSKLDEILLEKYGIEQHIFDKNFIFHTSILIFNNEEHIRCAFDEMRGVNIPSILNAEKIIIGSSKDGEPGTYKVNEEILL